MAVLAIIPSTNASGKKDVTGAFAPEARAWLRTRGAGSEDLIVFDSTAPPAARFAQVLRALRGRTGISEIAFFCHGWTRGIQAGITTANAARFAEALVAAGAHYDLTVTLYCCSTGGGPGVGGDNGFADVLRDRLCEAGLIDCCVDAHDRPGHTTRNPYVRRFEGTGVLAGAAGGQWIVAPGSALWPKWVRSLKGDLRFRFPWLSVMEIHKELAG